MGFKVYKKDNYPRHMMTKVTCYYEEESGRKAEAPGEGIGEIVFYARPALVGDMHLFSSDTETMDGFRDLLVELVVSADGLEDEDGTPVGKMSAEIIESLPLWMTTFLAQTLSSETAVEEGEESFSEPPSDTN
tara:strand:- start:212 stop:610 length:399 start_codon:yes stop_codon:yes gene_type:complete